MYQNLADRCSAHICSKIVHDMIMMVVRNGFLFDWYSVALALLFGVSSASRVNSNKQSYRMYVLLYLTFSVQSLVHVIHKKKESGKKKKRHKIWYKDIYFDYESSNNLVLLMRGRGRETGREREKSPDAHNFLWHSYDFLGFNWDLFNLCLNKVYRCNLV